MRRIARRFLCDKPVKWLLCLHEQTFDGQVQRAAMLRTGRNRVNRVGRWNLPYSIMEILQGRRCRM